LCVISFSIYREGRASFTFYQLLCNTGTSAQFPRIENSGL